MKKTVEISEGKIVYINSGQGEPLVLLHSLGVSSESWEKVIDPLKNGFSVYAWDMLGHGDSGKPSRNMLIEDHANNLSDFLDSLCLDSVFLCGNSVGALIAVDFAARYPDKVKNLVLIGCPCWDAWERSERLMLSALDYNIDGYPLPVTHEKIAMAYSKITPELINWVEKQHEQSGLWMKKTMIAINLYDAIEKLPKIKCPTLVIFGEDDLLIECQPTLLQGINKATKAIIPDSGHLPQIDNPEGLLNEITPFLKASGKGMDNRV